MQRIAVVVVTYNRLELLKQCIESVRNQIQKPNIIIVVNNGSTDGTLGWLNDQKNIIQIVQENIGGAGGFYTGMKFAYEKNFDWVWCMDDDCTADCNALEFLLKHLKNGSILNSLVLSSQNSENLAFGLYEFKRSNYYKEFKDVNEKEVIESQNFFNGSLFPRKVFKDVGFPSKELFIRGDEFEYFLRITKAGYNVYTITNSIIYHPPEKKIIVNLGIISYEFLFLNSFKRYYHTRNLLLISKNYDLISFKYFFKNFILDIIFIIFSQRKPSILISHIKGFLKGLFTTIKFP